MSGWILQPVVNVIIQLILLICAGWLFARLGILTTNSFLPQLNKFVLFISLPSFTL